LAKARHGSQGKKQKVSKGRTQKGTKGKAQKAPRSHSLKGASESAVPHQESAGDREAQAGDLKTAEKKADKTAGVIADLERGAAERSWRLLECWRRLPGCWRKLKASSVQTAV
jgi:hypothetical protein